MTAQQSHTSDRQRPRPLLQFSVRALMAGVAACCLFFSVWAWGGNAESFAAEFFLAVGVALIALGVLLRRYPVALAGAVVLVVLAFQVDDYHDYGLRMEVRAQTDVWRAEDLNVKVLDAATKQPIPNAHIRVTSDNGFDARVSEGQTDASGAVNMSVWLVYEIGPESVSTLRESCTRVEVHATGYKPSRTPPSALVLSHDLYGLDRDSPHPPSIIELRRE